MISQRQIKCILFLGLLVALILCCAAYLRWEKAGERDIGMITQEELDTLSPGYFIDLSMLYHHGEIAPADVPNETLFLSQPYSVICSEKPLASLSCLDPSCKLYLLDNEQSRDIPSAVKSSSLLTLIVVRGQQYQPVSLMLTTLPSITLNSLHSRDGMITENKYGTTYAGSYAFFNVDGNDDTLVQKGSAEWHIRGSSSATSLFVKKPWKLNIKKMTGQSSKVDFLGLGEDDDWILNSMVFDDLKLRDKFSMEFWNRHMLSSANLKMSSGKYVELFIDGEYMGLYLLQRRIDEEYIPISSETDIIFKGFVALNPDDISNCYEIIYSPYSTERSYAILEDCLNFRNDGSINMESFIDNCLFINYLSGGDNANYKNNYYIVRFTENGYELSFITWDTDLTLGATWSKGYNYDYAMDRILGRREYGDLKTMFPDLDIQLAQRWQELRQSVYTPENILLIIEENRSHLEHSGAVGRDLQKWGSLYHGSDTYELVNSFVLERLEYLDNYYAGILSNVAK